VNKQVNRRILSLLLALLLLGPAAGWAADYQVVVNANNPTDILTKEQLGKMFLKKIVKWDTGIPIVPVDQVPISPARAAFTKIIHGKPVSAIASYWQQQIFAGREVPPAEKAGDAAVLAFVKANPGAIGYISGGVTADGVKLLTIR
jgi:ABC-type phosphate transport system substrate-binding protein